MSDAEDFEIGMKFLTDKNDQVIPSTLKDLLRGLRAEILDLRTRIQQLERNHVVERYR